MKTKDYEKIIRNIAKQNGVTPQEVEHDMQAAIDEAMKSHDPAVCDIWNSIAPTGRKPSPQDVIEYAVNRVQRGITTT
ncbi:MAG TPA: sporulation initiation factor Spo0A C-terminal domain-containing protein [Bacillota bacterium]|nr:sporulation initiation factor Spo0A C-terminal domain-containing protein [Bacillota bacterium]